MKTKQSNQPRRWFRTVVSDFTTPDDDASVEIIDNMVDYYLSILSTGIEAVASKGTLSDLIQQSAGLHGYYNAMANDILQVRKWLETLQEHASANKFKWFQTSSDAKKEYGTSLKITDIRNFIKCDDVLVAYDMMIREISDIQHQMESLVSTLEVRGMSLSNVVKLRVAGIEAVFIDLSKASSNEG